jgi:hypothetical protein
VLATLIAMLAAAPVRAEVIGAMLPGRSPAQRVAVERAPHLHLAFEIGVEMKLATPRLLSISRALSGRPSFRALTHLGAQPLDTAALAKAAFDSSPLGTSLCLGVACSPRSTRGDTGPDGRPSGANESARLISSIGIGSAALKMFASPVPKKASAMALGVSPMFALGGGGVEMRCVWW